MGAWEASRLDGSWPGVGSSSGLRFARKGAPRVAETFAGGSDRVGCCSAAGLRRLGVVFDVLARVGVGREEGGVKI